MRRKKLARGLSLILTWTLVFGGNYSIPEVYAADTTTDAMSEITRMEKLMEEQLREEYECEYLEEPEDYSWMEKLLEEERIEEEQRQELLTAQGTSDENTSHDAETPGEEPVIFLEEEEPEEIEQPEDIEIFQASADDNVYDENRQEAEDAEIFSSGDFGEGSFETQSSPEETLPIIESGMEATFTSGESDTPVAGGEVSDGNTGDGNIGDGNTSGGDIFDGENPSETPGFSDQDGDSDSGSENDSDDALDSELGESEATLHLEEGEDFITELNILLYKAKDLATDEHPYKVIIPPGNYEIKGTISMYSNIHLYAVGAVMKKTSAKKQILMRLGNSEVSQGGYGGYRNITIEGGTWDCNYESCAKKDEPGGFVCFRLGHATNITVKDATFLNNLKSHFLEFGGVKHALVTGCTFEGYWTPYENTNQECIQIDSCMDGIFPRYQPFDGTVCTDIVIEKNVFRNVFAGAGSHSMMFNKPYTKIAVRNNKFVNVKKHSVWLLNCKDSEVSGNIMQNVGAGVYIASMRHTHTFFTEGQVPSIKQNQQSLNVVVSDNNISLAQTTTIAGKRWSSYGIWIGGQRVVSSSKGVPIGEYVIRGITVNKNVIKGTGNGIRLEKTISCKVTNNKLSLSKPDGYSNFGIYAGGSRNNQITGNTVSKSANIGIYVYTHSDYTYKSTGNKLVSNQVKNTGSHGICIGAGSNNTVLQKNTVSGNKRDGINVQKSVITSMVSNKAVSNGKTGIYCTGSTIKEQKKNTLEGNKSEYAIQFYKCKGQVQNVKKPVVSTVKRTSKKITGTGSGAAKAYVYTKSNKRLSSVKIGKNWKFSLPVKAQKKGTVLSVRVADKYGNTVRREIKVK